MMVQISEEKINEVMTGMNSLAGNPLDGLFEKMDKEQHAVSDYLFEVEEDSLNADERDLLISFATLGWHIVAEALNAVRTVDGDELNGRLEKNVEILERLEEEGDFDSALLGMITDETEQPVLMGFLAGLVVDRPEEYAGTIRDQMVPVIILHIKTVIDCLIAV